MKKPFEDITIGIIGLGYVGLPLALRFAKVCKKVIALDVDIKKIGKLSSGISYIEHISSDEIEELVQTQKLIPTNEYEDLKICDSISICVPTPLNQNREPDLTYVSETAKNIAPNIREEQLLVLESTVHPGCTETELRNTLEEFSKLKAGDDFHLAFSPEREDPGNKSYTLGEIPKIIGGYTKRCEEKATYI